MKLYLAGPMQNIPEFNFPLFNATAKALRAKGHEVFNPAEKDSERHGGVNIGAGNHTGDIKQAVAQHGFSLRQALEEDCVYICRHAEGIVMLPGWQRSYGACAEHALATALRLDFFYIPGTAGDIAVLGDIRVPEAA